jgi:hypothetical protein
METSNPKPSLISGLEEGRVASLHTSQLGEAYYSSDASSNGVLEVWAVEPTVAAAAAASPGGSRATVVSSPKQAVAKMQVCNSNGTPVCSGMEEAAKPEPTSTIKISRAQKQFVSREASAPLRFPHNPLSPINPLSLRIPDDSDDGHNYTEFAQFVVDGKSRGNSCSSSSCSLKPPSPQAFLKTLPQASLKTLPQAPIVTLKPPPKYDTMPETKEINAKEVPGHDGHNHTVSPQFVVGGKSRGNSFSSSSGPLKPASPQASLKPPIQALLKPPPQASIVTLKPPPKYDTEQGTEEVHPGEAPGHMQQRRVNARQHKPLVKFADLQFENLKRSKKQTTGSRVQQASEWNLPEGTTLNKAEVIRELMAWGKEPTILYASEAESPLHKKRRKRGHPIRSGKRPKPVPKQENIPEEKQHGRVFLATDIEFDTRYLQWDDTPSGSMNMLIERSMVHEDSKANQDDFLERIPDPLPLTTSSSRVGIDFQARIPDCRTYRDKRGDGYLPRCVVFLGLSLPGLGLDVIFAYTIFYFMVLSYTTLWNPLLADEAECRGEDIQGFLQQDFELSKKELLMELLHLSDYSVQDARLEYERITKFAGEPSSRFSRHEAAQFQDFLKSHRKDFTALSQGLRCTRSECMIHYYNWKRQQEYQRYKKEWKADYCMICEDGGELLICDGCNRAYHGACAGVRRVPEGAWVCPACAKSLSSSTEDAPPNVGIPTANQVSSQTSPSLSRKSFLVHASANGHEIMNDDGDNEVPSTQSSGSSFSPTSQTSPWTPKTIISIDNSANRLSGKRKRIDFGSSLSQGTAAHLLLSPAGSKVDEVEEVEEVVQVSA